MYDGAGGYPTDNDRDHLSTVNVLRAVLQESEVLQAQLDWQTASYATD